MKEKETATCPICGGELQIQGQALFKEHHKRLWEKKAEECGVTDAYKYSFGRLSHGEYASLGSVKNKPAELIRWEAENPIPDVDLIGFVVSLAKHLVGLGKEKGGQQ